MIPDLSNEAIFRAFMEGLGAGGMLGLIVAGLGYAYFAAPMRDRDYWNNFLEKLELQHMRQWNRAIDPSLLWLFWKTLTVNNFINERVPKDPQEQSPEQKRMAEIDRMVTEWNDCKDRATTDAARKHCDDVYNARIEDLKRKKF